MARASKPGAKITLSGDKELKKLFEELPKKVIKKGLRRAITLGASPIVKDAKAHVRTETKLLKKAINKKIKTYKNGNVVAIIGASRSVSGESVRLGRGKNVRVRRFKKRVPAYYIHLVEKGTRPHSLAKGSRLAREGKAASTAKGQDVGRIHPGAKAYPFLEPAFRRNIGKATAIATAVLKQVVESEAAKLASKGR